MPTPSREIEIAALYINTIRSYINEAVGLIDNSYAQRRLLTALHDLQSLEITLGLREEYDDGM